MTPKDPFLEGTSGTSSGGPFAPGRFCLLPKCQLLQQLGFENQFLGLRQSNPSRPQIRSCNTFLQLLEAAQCVKESGGAEHLLEPLQGKGPFRFNQPSKRSTNSNFWLRIPSGGVGVFHVNGWGPKSSACPQNPGKQTFGQDIPGFLPGYPSGAQWRPKSSRKTMLYSIFLSLLY